MGKVAQVIPSIRECSEQELGKWLQHYVLEVRKQNGEEYPYKTLYKLCCGIQRVYNDSTDGTYRPPVKIFDPTNQHFYRFYHSLDSKMAELQHAGIGIETNQADIITDEDINQLWETDTISISESKGLSYGVYFYNNICFGMRSADEHRSVSRDMYRIVQENGVEKLVFT